MAKIRSKGKKKSPTKKANRKHDEVVEADGMVVLRSNDGLELMVSKLEASLSITIRNRIKFGVENYLIPFDGDKSNHTPIQLGVEGKILSKLVEYWKKQASGSQARGDDDKNWYAKFVDVDNKTLCDLILAASYLRDQGLLDLTCHTVSKMIKGRSSEDIRRIFNITSDATRRKEKSAEQMVKTYNRLVTEFLHDYSMEPNLTEEEQPSLLSPPLNSDVDRNPELKLEVNATMEPHLTEEEQPSLISPPLNSDVDQNLELKLEVNATMEPHLTKEQPSFISPPLRSDADRNPEVKLEVNDTMEPHLTEEEHPLFISLPLKSDQDRNRKLKLEVNVLRALHIVRCQEFTGYDPKLNDFMCTRFCDYNIAFFDLDKLSLSSRGPPLHSLREPKSRRITESSVNVISVKVVESDVGYPFSVFGTVLARDEVDYRCVYLFRRRRDDAQLITSPDDMLTLTDPCRGLDSSDKIYFEIDLKIKTDGGGAKDFSKGLLVFNSICVNEETVTGCLTSWMSSVELAYVHVPSPLEANIAVKILKGPCNLSRVDAATSGNMEDHFISLYDSEAAGTGTVVGNDGFVALTRHMVAVPLDEKLVLFLAGDDGAEQLVLRFGHTLHSKEHYICKMGSGEVQVIVAWTAIPRKKRRKWEVIGGERLLQ